MAKARVADPAILLLMGEGKLSTDIIARAEQAVAAGRKVHAIRHYTRALSGNRELACAANLSVHRRLTEADDLRDATVAIAVALGVAQSGVEAISPEYRSFLALMAGLAAFRHGLYDQAFEGLHYALSGAGPVATGVGPMLLGEMRSAPASRLRRTSEVLTRALLDASALTAVHRQDLILQIAEAGLAEHWIQVQHDAASVDGAVSVLAYLAGVGDRPTPAWVDEAYQQRHPDAWTSGIAAEPALNAALARVNVPATVIQRWKVAGTTLEGRDGSAGIQRRLCRRWVDVRQGLKRALSAWFDEPGLTPEMSDADRAIGRLILARVCAAAGEFELAVEAAVDAGETFPDLAIPALDLIEAVIFTAGRSGMAGEDIETMCGIVLSSPLAAGREQSFALCLAADLAAPLPTAAVRLAHQALLDPADVDGRVCAQLAHISRRLRETGSGRHAEILDTAVAQKRLEPWQAERYRQLSTESTLHIG